MDRQPKGKKVKHVKHHDKAKQHSPIVDAKSIIENMKISEILRTVKINSSMRLRAPRGSKVMDFAEVEEIVHEHNKNNPPEQDKASENGDANPVCSEVTTSEAENQTKDADAAIHESISSIDDVISGLSEDTNNREDKRAAEKESGDTENGPASCRDTLSVLPNINTERPNRVRKLSLDQTMLSRRGSLSQSDVDLHVVGKSPLERKSSFFRKKMNSFLRNTSEIFKRQSLGSGDAPRRGSTSFSLQSLHDGAGRNSPMSHSQELHGSFSSLSSAQLEDGSSCSSQSLHRAAGSCQPQLASCPGQLLESVQSLDEAYLMEQMLGSRAISMSSGLDSEGTNKRKNRSKRVTWLASEGLTNYLRRVINDERPTLASSRSFQDGKTEGPKDSRGRRLSYQRAVSGEDPVTYNDSSLRSRHIAEHSEGSFSMTEILDAFNKKGVPPLEGFDMFKLSDDSKGMLYLQSKKDRSLLYDWSKKYTAEYGNLSDIEWLRQAAIRELIATEADYIEHLFAVVEVFMATAHWLQRYHQLQDLVTARLFINLPDVLNASLRVWDTIFYPMLRNSLTQKCPFSPMLMRDGFFAFRETVRPYERYMMGHSRAVDYLRSLETNEDFEMYLNWCQARPRFKRLQLRDILVKPIQRLTKYTVLLDRIIEYTIERQEKESLTEMHGWVKAYIEDVNRTVRQREELNTLDRLAESIDAYEIDFRDDDMNRLFKFYSSVNLKAPMMNCNPCYSRTLIYEADVHFRDNLKETDVRAILMTDMLLICKKITPKRGKRTLKLMRQKFMIHRLNHYLQFNNKTKTSSIIFVYLDEMGSACAAFTFEDLSKEGDYSFIKAWDYKLREARVSYNLGVWRSIHPTSPLADAEAEILVDYNQRYPRGMYPAVDDEAILRAAIERLAVMTHPGTGGVVWGEPRSLRIPCEMGAGEPNADASSSREARVCHPMFRSSTDSSTRSSHSQNQRSGSSTSHEEPQAGPSQYQYAAGSSVEHHIPPQNPNDDGTSITVNVVEETDDPQPSTSRASLHVHYDSRCNTPGDSRAHSRPPSPGHSPGYLPTRFLCLTHQRRQLDRLKVSPRRGVLALVHSLPDLTYDPTAMLIGAETCGRRTPSPPSAAEKLYSHHLHRSRMPPHVPDPRLYSPAKRGKSFPPNSTARVPLRRGNAFNQSIKAPPARLEKMKHVDSEQLQEEPDRDIWTDSDEDVDAVNPVLVPDIPQPEEEGVNTKKDAKNRKKDRKQSLEHSLENKAMESSSDCNKNPEGNRNGGAGLLERVRSKTSDAAKPKDKE